MGPSAWGPQRLRCRGNLDVPLGDRGVREAPSEILFDRRGTAGFVTLNRPQALNAVTLGMVRAFTRQLREWQRDPAITRIVLAAAGGRAFSAGGDIRALYDAGTGGRHEAMLAFYGEEYVLNTMIKHYPKPYVALIDGICMGGGVGVSVHGSHRIAGDRYLFAMPEVGIGFFPDVGATWFLPRRSTPRSQPLPNRRNHRSLRRIGPPSTACSRMTVSRTLSPLSTRMGES